MRFLFALVAVLPLLGCVAEEPGCASDDECAPATCCHATEAVHVSLAPDCQGDFAACTDEFVSCSMDEPDVRPVCSFGSCEMAMPLRCALLAPFRE